MKCRLLSAMTVLFGLLLCPWVARGQYVEGQSPSSKEIRSNLQEILHRPEFNPETTQPGPLAKSLEQMRTRVEKAWKQFTDWFQKLFRGGGGSMGAVGTAIVYALIAVLVALGIAALARVIIARNRTRGRTPPPRALDTPQTVASKPTNAPPGEWIANAARLAANRDFRGAFRAVFMAILLELDRAGQIEYERSRTNGDYLGLLRSRNLRPLYELLAPLTRDFDLHWYGNRQATEADYQRSLATFHRLTSLNTDARTSGPLTPGDGNGVAAAIEGSR